MVLGDLRSFFLEAFLDVIWGVVLGGIVAGIVACGGGGTNDKKSVGSGEKKLFRYSATFPLIFDRSF